MKKSTTIKISFKLRDKLAEMGKKGQTYENIIWKLVEKFEKNKSSGKINS